MTAREVLALCCRHGDAGTFVVATSTHGDVSPSDVRHVLGSAFARVPHLTRGWVVDGKTLDGERVALTVIADDDAVTVIAGERLRL